MREKKSADPAAAEDFLACVKHGRLAWSDGALRLAEMYARGSGVERRDLGFGGFVAIADADHRLHRRVGNDVGNPVHVAHLADRAAEFLVLAHDETIPRAVKRDDVHRRLSAGKSQALALTYRELMQPIVPAQNFTGSGDDIARFLRQIASLLLQISLDKLHVISRRDKTDFLALGLFRDGNLQAARDFADFVLLQFAEGKIGARELLLRKAEEEISLVLGFVHGSEKFVAAGMRIVAHASVVAGGNALGANLARSDEELIELHVIVAHGARDGRAAFEIIRDEGTDDVELELALEIHDVERDPEMFGDAARVVHIVVRATAMLRGAVILQLRQAALIPELHSEADDGLRAVVEDRGDRGAVHTTAHRYGDGGRGLRGCDAD